MLKWISGNNIINDQEAENKLISEKWHTYSTYADLDKIKDRMISIKYFIEQQKNLEYYCNEKEIMYLLNKHDGLKSERMKSNIRNGIPIKYTRQILLKLFNVELSDYQINENYKTRFVSIFKNRDPKSLGDNVPYLYYYDNLNENLGFNYLNNNGLETLKELLWLLYSVVPNIEFCPFLIKIIAFCLIFLNKYEAFAMIKNMIIVDYSIDLNEINNLRFRLRFNYEENKRLIPSFVQSLVNISNTGKEILQKFEKLGFDFELLIEDMFFSIFAEYFNFLFFHKIFLLYLREGVKVLYRIAYSVLKTFKKDILEINTPDNVIKLIRSKCYDLKDPSIFSISYYYKLNHYNNMYDNIKVMEIFSNNNHKNFYIPTINGDSTILSDDDLFNLWSIFPDNFKSKDAKLIYSTDYHDTNLNNIYNICSDPENSCFNSFIVIKSFKSIFGVIMSIPFDKSRGRYYKPVHTSIFIIKPFINRYDIIKNSEKIILCSDDKLIIGYGEFGPAIAIDKDLNYGVSYKSDIFGSPSLASLYEGFEDENSFKIDKIEIFILY